MATRKKSLHLDVDVTDPYHTSDSQSDRPGMIEISRTVAGTTYSYRREFMNKADFKETYAKLLKETIDAIVSDNFA
jgi:hypothetical protein